MRGRAESYGSALKRLALPWSIEGRQTIERWIADLPIDVAGEVGGRFWSDHVANSASAFWEVYLAHTFMTFGHAVGFHPAVPDSSARPDFLVRTSAGDVFVEAVSLLADEATQRESRFVDELRRQLIPSVPARYRVAVSLARVGDDSVDKCPLGAWLHRWLHELPASPTEARMSAIFDDGPWAAGVEAQAATFDACFGEAERRSLRVVISGPGHGLIEESRFLDVVAQKASKYGKLPHPLVLAVHASSSICFMEDAGRVLYGDPPGERIIVAKTRVQSPYVTAVRAPIWGSRSRASHLDGVLVADTFLQPWSVSRSSPVLFLPPRQVPAEVLELPWLRASGQTDFDSESVALQLRAIAARIGGRSARC